MGRTLGIDTGGTFTDLVLRDARGGERAPRIAKVPSTPDDPVRSILAGIELLGGLQRGDHVVHGTTVALNALLEGRLARVALVTNEGFADVLEIGRQDRPDIYALHPRRPEPLVPRALRFEVASRVWPGPAGEGLERVQRPTRAELGRLARALRSSGAESVAIGLLHSYADPREERAVARALRSLGLPLTCSAELLPEHREVERWSTAVVNAALVPLMRAYLGSIEARLGGARLSLLQSAGGTLHARRAAEEPVRVLLSGPAGGAVGASRAAREAGFDAFVAFDMGGTSTDVCFRAGKAARAGELAHGARRIGGQLVALPSLDLHTIGCGGGSLVRIDTGGILHVGPESAGASPGPVAYGASDVPTVTDAHVLLGHVANGPFLGGHLALDARAVERAFARLARRLACTPSAAARAVLELARAATRRALGVMTLQRGADPASLPLVAFGGAGGLHGCALAASLGMRGVLVPRFPGALSAWGMTHAAPEIERVETVLAPLASVPRRERSARLAALTRSAVLGLVEMGVERARIEVEATLDLRYRGQSFELRLADGPNGADGADPTAAFHRAHERLYGHAFAGREVELVCLRARVRARSSARRLRTPPARPLPRSALIERRTCTFDKAQRTPVVERDRLPPGCVFAGPVLIEEYSGTTLVPPGWKARVTAGGHLWLTAVG